MDNKNGYVGGFVGGQEINENAGSYAGGIISEKEGVINNAGTQGGYVGGYVGQEGNIGGYVGQEGNIGFNQNQKANTQLPAKIGVWSKVKAFLFQEVDLNKKIVVKLSPKEEKVLTEVHDFLFQEVSFKGIKDFLFQDITFGKKKKNRG